MLKNQIWDLSGYTTRCALDLAMKTNAGAEATALWEKYCPWSNTNGGYVNWIKK